MSTLQVIGEKQEVVTEAIAGDYMGITCTATLCLVRDIPVLSETLSVWASSPIPVIFSFLYSFLLCVLTALNLFTLVFWKYFPGLPLSYQSITVLLPTWSQCFVFDACYERNIAGAVNSFRGFSWHVTLATCLFWGVHGKFEESLCFRYIAI